MKNLIPIIISLLLSSTQVSAQSAWQEPTLLGILEESLTYIEVGAENNLSQDGVHRYFTTVFDKAAFDQLYNTTAEYGWDTVAYHYLNSLYFLNQPNVTQARKSCYAAGQAYLQTDGMNRNVLSRFGFYFEHINHLREYIDLGEHRGTIGIGFDGTTEVKNYQGFSDLSDIEIPQFPWPPPEASADYVLPNNFFEAAQQLGDMDAQLTEALESCGYDSKSYFAVPGGFALVTQMEQFNEDGSSKLGADRWNPTLEPASFDLRDYFKALFWGRTGKYRIIVFIVSNQAFVEETNKIDRDSAQKWLKTGMKWLPDALAQQPFGREHRCTALVYEFELQEAYTEARFLMPASLTAREHLRKNGMWQYLKK